MRMGRHSLPIFNEGDSPPPPRKRSKVGPPEIHAERNVVLKNPVRFKEDLRALRAFIDTHSLTDIATQSISYNEGVVREFYESFPEDVSSTTKEVNLKVGGKRIKLSPSIIGKFLGLAPISNEDEAHYFETIRGITNEDLVSETYDPSTPFNKRIQSGSVKAIYRTFWLFIRHDLFPNSQHSEIPFEGCRHLVVMVRNNMPIPFASLIYHSILGYVTKKKGGGELFFPCLITRMCAKAKVAMVGPNTDAHGALDESSIERSDTQKRITNRGGAPPPPSSSSSQGGSSSHTTPPTSSYPPPTPFDPSLCDPNLLAMFHHFNDQNMTRFGHIDARFGDMDSRFDSVDAQFGEMRTMITHFANMRVGSGASSSGHVHGATQGNDGNASNVDNMEEGGQHDT